MQQGLISILKLIVAWPVRLLCWGLCGLIYIYRWFLSPAKVALLGPQARCRFEPCCSSYALEALRTLPLATALGVVLKRIARCQPWGAQGEDPVPKIK
ncbi:MAG TPA: membrane protein insertion efficiency factor YidD [Opitutales bacterium]|nr:membrane protein insertion efficiency factor YidD [Opitutales bacterium]